MRTDRAEGTSSRWRACSLYRLAEGQEKFGGCKGRKQENERPRLNIPVAQDDSANACHAQEKNGRESSKDPIKAGTVVESTGQSRIWTQPEERERGEVKLSRESNSRKNCVQREEKRFCQGTRKLWKTINGELCVC